MNILVSGATGFIGSHLCDALVKRGHAVTALSRNPNGALVRVPGLIRAVPWEPVAGRPPSDAFDGIDGVVHLAGETLKGRWTAEKKRALRESRVAGTRNLVSALEPLTSRPKVLVSASATGYYGNRGEETLTEQSSPGDDFLAEVCVSWEREALRARDMGVRVVTLRTGLVLGRPGPTLGAMLPLFRLGLGGPMGPGKQWWPWVHEDDLVGMMETALEASAWEGPVNAVAPEPARQRDFAKALGRVLKRPAMMPVPSFALRLVAGEVATELLYSRRALPVRAQALGYQFKHPDIEASLRDLVRGAGVVA